MAASIDEEEEMPAASEVSSSDDSSAGSARNRVASPLPKLSSLPAYRPSNMDSLFGGRVIGPKDLMELAACPCCQQQLDDGHTHSTLNEPARSCNNRQRQEQQRQVLHQHRNRGSLLSSDDKHNDMDEDEEEDILPGVLAAGQEYTPRRIVVEGWLHKKGTGLDWLGSRAWKARWARLALAKVQGYTTDVPVLMIYWFHPSTIQSTPSTVILLDSTVILPVEKTDKERWNAYRFEIRHASTRENMTIPVTRTFTAPQKSRDAWVYAISQALLDYEKRKARRRQLATRDHYTAVSRSRSPERVSVPIWTSDRFVSVPSARPTSPASFTSAPRRTLSPTNSPPLPSLRKSHTAKRVASYSLPGIERSSSL